MRGAEAVLGERGRFAKLILDRFRPEIDDQVVSTVFDNKILLFFDLSDLYRRQISVGRLGRWQDKLPRSWAI
jgi:hypothetical protein